MSRVKGNYTIYIYNEKKDKRSPVLQCECGRKYVKTRDGQVKCLFCMNGKIPLTGAQRKVY